MADLNKGIEKIENEKAKEYFLKIKKLLVDASLDENISFEDLALISGNTTVLSREIFKIAIQ